MHISWHTVQLLHNLHGVCRWCMRATIQVTHRVPSLYVSLCHNTYGPLHTVAARKLVFHTTLPSLMYTRRHHTHPIMQRSRLCCVHLQINAKGRVGNARASFICFAHLGCLHMQHMGFKAA